MNLYEQWLEAKDFEKQASERRREIEDQLTSIIGDFGEGSKTIDDDGYRIVATSRYSRKVDADQVQVLAAEKGVENLLPILFRWKPEINLIEWKKADTGVINYLSNAIVTKPGRITYKIEKIEK